MHEPSSLSQSPELLPDVLRDISGRLRDAGDLVSFHAVCKPWRDSHDPTRKQLGLPWLLAPDMMMTTPLSIFLNMRCIFSRTSYWALPPFSIRKRNWVASADGTGLWYYGERPSPSLHDAITGAVTLVLPPIPQEKGRWEGSPGGIVYGDGAVLVYHISRLGQADATKTKFRAAILRPGDVAWMVVERTFRSPEFLDLYPVYHRGKILITVGDTVPTPDSSEVAIGNVQVVSRPWMASEVDQHFCQRYYVLESRGELLCVSVYISHDYVFAGKASVPGLVRSISMTVHALQEEAESAPENMCWVRKDGGSLADRVLFLGWPNSFAVDASRLSHDAVSGGCAYFVYADKVIVPDQQCYVFRYNLVDGKVKFVERLPEDWYHDMYMWLFPQPSIAPIEEIINRRKWWKKNKQHKAPTPRRNIYIETPEPQCYNTYFRVFVRNLPPKVDSIQLRQFFSHHGKVYNGKVMWKRKNKMSKKIGLITIAMAEEWPDALAVLNGLVFNGCILEVSLVRRWKGLCAPCARQNMHGLDHPILGLLLLFVIAYLIFLICIQEKQDIWSVLRRNL